ncbi:AMP-binding protein [Acinetobacter sp. MD2(2019)]|uniref:AMP-binding protein n=1 Tax=Acinetobacter sp. MD2(2019) TaxID=2605273 RepID=UPI002D1E4DD7|nr:AMP-binding protein [Acinetobacter sp. MD2(2019)]MEB3753605.1 AMP-binding protein [Acinetobacter sp. MD2(2019)]
MKLCHFNDYLTADTILCFDAELQTISFSRFWQDVSHQATAISAFKATAFALWEPDSYEFLVLFFACLYAKKRLILPPNRVPQLQQQLAEEGIEFIQRQECANAPNIQPFTDEDLSQSQIVFFTSGSTGEPKKIHRTLQQLLSEVQGLAQSFNLPAQAVAIATVSHQHIYGLLFKVLLPLATGRAFYREQFIYPEYVVQLQQQLNALQLSNYLVTSPALLKRWSAELQLQHCVALYSSGGKLDSGIRGNINVTVTEVFGSSETGGIAYRHADDALWQPFADVDVSSDAQQQLSIRSLHACDTTDWVATGDRVELIQHDDLKSPFRLLGRVDRIVKLEEKRLSLDEIEHKIEALSQINQCHVLLVPHEQRELLACVVALNEDEMLSLQQQGKHSYVRQLKQQLQTVLEPIAIPRQWRFLSQLPRNSQSKLNKQDMTNLFQDAQYPVVLSYQQHTDQAIYQLEFPPELICFKGHFPNQPIYPGVGQIAFLRHFSMNTWADLGQCLGFEQLKFQDLICPHFVLTLTLVRKQHKVSFELKHQDKAIASGRLLFACQESTP